MTEKSYELLGFNSSLAKQLTGFIPRKSQQDMAHAVSEAIEKKQVLITEAGTGTGKTFAYLMPALLSQKKVIISTATKNLQDQLFHRDLPMIRKSLGIPSVVALLKGRSNYLCLYRLEINVPDISNEQSLSDYAAVIDWSKQTRDGDISALDQIAEDSVILPLVTSTVDNCLGQECPRIEDCFILKARRRAQQADLLVINHHLFFANFSLQQDGFGELLPESEVIIFDEAHQLHEIASQFLGISISSRQIIQLARDVKLEALKIAKDMQDIFWRADKLEIAVRNMRLAFAIEQTKNAWQSVSNNKQLQERIADLNFTLDEMQQILQIAAGRSKGLENCYERCQNLQVTFNKLTAQSPMDQIHWYETFKKSFVIHHTPLTIAPIFKNYLENASQSFIFTSATLTVDDHFRHFAAGLGIEHYESQHLASPFNYKQQSLLYLPRNMPNPNDPTYNEVLLHAALPVIEASKGRAFFLFTSYRSLKFAANWLHEKIHFPLLIQGDSPKAELVNRFCQLGNAVLLGTSSFWEGVDVRGSALSLVIIDKLPFAPPDDPILQARSTVLKKQNKQPFYDYQLPNAIIDLKQGAGRLIRDVNDRGVLMIADPRLTGRNYGELFFKGLPAMQRTRDLLRVVEFIKQNEKSDETISH